MLPELFFGFLKVGCFSFGGAYAAIPLIRDVVTSYGWISEEMLATMIAIAESTPGPIMINLATYVGLEMAGPAGAIIATFAVVLPSFVIILALTEALSRVTDNPYVKAVLKCLKPAMAGIILATGIWMILKNTASGDIRVWCLTLALIAIKMYKKNLSAISLIIVSALLGIVIFAI